MVRCNLNTNNGVRFIPSKYYFLNIRVLPFLTVVVVGRDSSVGIATRYGLDGPGIESRWVARLSAPVQTGSGAHPASCTMDAGSFP